MKNKKRRGEKWKRKKDTNNIIFCGKDEVHSEELGDGTGEGGGGNLAGFGDVLCGAVWGDDIERKRDVEAGLGGGGLLLLHLRRHGALRKEDVRVARAPLQVVALAHGHGHRESALSICAERLDQRTRARSRGRQCAAIHVSRRCAPPLLLRLLLRRLNGGRTRAHGREVAERVDDVGAVCRVACSKELCEAARACGDEAEARVTKGCSTVTTRGTQVQTRARNEAQQKVVADNEQRCTCVACC